MARFDVAWDAAVRSLGAPYDAVFVRDPVVDPSCPDTADVDLLVFADVDDLLVERRFSPEGAGHPPVDLIWLPSRWLADPETFARRGVLAHRLLTSRVLVDGSGRWDEHRRRVREVMFRPDVHANRITALLEMGFLTVREIGVTRDFPPLALFWLHMAFAAALAALADLSKALCPNVYTRPFDYTDPLEAETGVALRERFTRALRLSVDVEELVPALRRVHAVVSARFPEPSWPETLRRSTRCEYRYFSSRRELDLRIEVAREMERRGNAPNGVFYLRFLAYALARVPSVHQRARESRDVSFLRPDRAMGTELRELCPEILEDLASLLGDHCDAAAVDEGLEAILALRARVVDLAASRGLPLSDVSEWAPFRARTLSRSTHLQGVNSHAQDRSDL